MVYQPPAVLLGSLLLFLAAPFLHSQALTVSPAALVIRMAHTGPLAVPQTVSVASGGSAGLQWTATASADPPWIELSASAGATPASVSVGVVSWRAESQPPGTYTGKVTFTVKGLPDAIVSVTWTVVPRLPNPTFSYPVSPVQGCRAPDSGSYPDPAVCTVPGEKPPGSFQSPPLGGTYVDPNFGANVKVITGLGVYHTYSANNPLSANNKYLMTFLSDGSYNVVDSATGQVLFAKVHSNQDFTWDSDNDSVYYYPSGTAFIKHDLASGAETTLVDYAKDGHKFTAIARGGTGGASKDNWISFFAPNEKQVCTLNLMAVKTYCADYGKAPGIPYGEIDYVLDSKGVDQATGKRYAILVAKGANPGIYSVNLTAGRLDLEYRGPEDPGGNGNHDNVCDPGEKCMYPSHSDTFEDSSGTEYLVFDTFSNSPCEVSTSTYQLNKGLLIMQPVELGGGRRRVMSLWQCPFPNSHGGTDDHVGCARKAPYCVISTVPPYRSATELPLRFPHSTEILVMRENGLEVRRLAESRSVRFTEEGSEAYWAEPRAAISNDGSLVVSDSNFGELKGVRVTLINTGFGKPQPAMLNAASLTPSLAPGGYAALLGSGLASCSASADSQTLPTTLCGTGVTFNGIPAPLTYASPGQVNVLVPRSLEVQRDVAVSVAVDGTGAVAQATVAAANFAEAAPAIFRYALEDGIARAVVQNAGSVLNGPTGLSAATAPARLGEVQVLWANALGPTDLPVADGFPAPSDTPVRTLRTVEVFVNGVPQTVSFSGMAPGYSGIYRVDLELNTATPVLAEGRNYIWLRVNGVESPQLAISIQ